MVCAKVFPGDLWTASQMTNFSVTASLSTNNIVSYKKWVLLGSHESLDWHL